MNRREFIRLGAMAGAGLSLPGCVSISARYTKPRKLVRREESLLVHNASLVDVRAGEVVPGQSLLLQRGKIAAIWPVAQARMISADREVDLGGSYLVPGLINAHCHLTLPCGMGFSLGFVSSMERQAERNAEECVKHGVTTVRDMLSPLNWMTTLQEKIQRGQITGPRILSSAAVQVRGGYCRHLGYLSSARYWHEANNPGEAREAVKKAVDASAGALKLFQQPCELFLPEEPLPLMDVPTMAAVCDEAARLGRSVALHHVGLDGLRRGLAAGVCSFEHLATDGELSEQDLAALLSRKAHVVPTLSVPFALAYQQKGDPNWGKGQTLEIAAGRRARMGKLLAEYCEPEIRAQGLRSLAKLSDPRNFENPPDSFYLAPRLFVQAAARGRANLLALQRAGIALGAGNDGGAPLLFPGAMGLELEMMERSGIPGKDVLRSATLENARLLGMEDRLGSLEQGKLADLVVLEKNPLETVAHLETVRMVFLDGELVFDRAAGALMARGDVPRSSGLADRGSAQPPIGKG